MPMPEVAIMLEGQMGLNWGRLKRIAQSVEDLGFAGLFRSDHFTNPNPPDEDSLELWVSLTWLADHTDRIEFGPLVSPVSFRHPAMTARMAAAVDNLSGGRLILGVGAGWQDREHENYSYNLLDMDGRFARFEEGLRYFKGVLHNDEPFSMDGDYYHFHDAVVLPRPSGPGRPPILIGGNGRTRTLPLVAQYADEWNGVFITAEMFAALNARLDSLLQEQGRAPDSVRRSLMTGLVFGRTDAEVRENLSLYGGRDADEQRARGNVVGTASAVQEQLARLGEAGVQRVMLQWLNLDDLDGLAALAGAVL